MIFILLPAYNEEKSFEYIFEKFDDLFKNSNGNFKVLVCNDGSTDNTSSVLSRLSKTYPIEVIDHKINRGLGETSRDLFERAVELSKHDDVFVRLDCDDTHDPSIITSMIKKLNEGCDVVIASRFQPGGGQKGLNMYRTFISYSANLFMKALFNIKNVRDYSSGYRAYRAIIIHKAINLYGNQFIQLKGLGFTCTLEKLVKLHLIGARFSEVPFVLRYDNKKSPSKMVSSITTFGYFTMALFYHWPWGGWKRGYKNRMERGN